MSYYLMKLLVLSLPLYLILYFTFFRNLADVAKTIGDWVEPDEVPMYRGDADQQTARAEGKPVGFIFCSAGLTWCLHIFTGAWIDGLFR